MSKPIKYDAIVLGLGVMGSAVAYQLAKNGARVLAVDQFDPPHNFGSSHGSSRITRQAIGEGEHYTPLVLRSNEIWREMESETGLDLLETMGLLLVSNDSQTTVTHVENFFQSTVDVAKKFGINHELLNPEEIRKRFPAYAVTNDEYGYYEEGAGVLLPENCVRAQLQLAKKFGAEIRTNERVVYYGEAESGLVVNTSEGEYFAAKVVICAGAWLPDLLRDNFLDLVKVYRQTLFWFKPDEEIQRYEKDQFPLFIWEMTGMDSCYYGVPAMGGVGGGIKVATEQYVKITKPGEMKMEVSQKEIDDIYENFVRHKFPGLKNECVKATACLYTVSSDSHFILDWHPEMNSVYLVSACSGHGFKHAAAIGESVAQQVLGGRGGQDISAFKLWRFH
ncbi:N-methyl-L-tryptophan oxidase [Crocinitomix catalasitica]|nr:N-methyl-L-tryptophan oxidase [Crocinitomix catalasitica]